MKNIHQSPITSIIGIIIALFTLAGLWYQKLDIVAVSVLFIVSTGFLFGKDTIITKYIKK